MSHLVKTITIVMALFSIFGCKKAAENTPLHPQDVIEAADGSKITITFYAHASLGFTWNGHQIYVDPVGDNFDWAAEPKADLVLITHDHYDHFDQAVVDVLTDTGDCTRMKPGETADPFDGVHIEAVPAYNISEGHLQFHPKERGDAGYLITLGGTVIYVAGDTEDNEDVLSLSGIDIAFLPVNQPYTMTVEQCVKVVQAIRPKVFYPYHYGGTETVTDVDSLAAALEGVTEVRIRPME